MNKTMDTALESTIDAARFRSVLGHYPTGVSVVTASGTEGPAGMVVGTFTSVSLDPPLVAFLPDKSSTSWPLIRASGSFCANVLSAEQEQLCRQFAKSGGNKFDGVTWQPGPSGSPILDGVVAWVDCNIEQVVESGDHYIVIGRVQALDVKQPAAPLAFIQGKFGQVLPPAEPPARAKGAADHVPEPKPRDRPMEQVVAELFAERGSRADMAQEIAALAGVPVEKFGELFSSREEIVAQLLTGYLESLRTQYQAELGRSSGKSAALTGLIRQTFASVKEHRAAAILFQNERANLTPNVRSSIEEIERQIQELWTGTVQGGIDGGEFRTDVDPAVVYYFLRDAAFLSARWYRPDGRYTIDELASQYAQIMLHGVALPGSGA